MPSKPPPEVQVVIAGYWEFSISQPVEIERKGRVVRIETKGQDKSIFETLTPHPGSIVGCADGLVHVDWSQEWKPDLP